MAAIPRNDIVPAIPANTAVVRRIQVLLEREGVIEIGQRVVSCMQRFKPCWCPWQARRRRHCMARSSSTTHFPGQFDLSPGTFMAMILRVTLEPSVFTDPTLRN